MQTEKKPCKIRTSLSHVLKHNQIHKCSPNVRPTNIYSTMVFIVLFLLLFIVCIVFAACVFYYYLLFALYLQHVCCETDVLTCWCFSCLHVFFCCRTLRSLGQHIFVNFCISLFKNATYTFL